MTEIEDALFGNDGTTRIVAVETRDDAAVLLIRSDDNAATRQEIVPFRPWLVLRERRDLPQSESEMLSGGTADGYNCLVRFDNRRAFHEARRILRDERRENLCYPSETKMFLIGSGRTLFKGMTFPEVRRMQIDIETTDLSPTSRTAKIFLIAASDNLGHEAVLFGDEREMLTQLNDLVQAWDPDILEGHNFYAFDLPWMRIRAEKNGLTLNWGRDGSAIVVGQERNCAIGANTRPFTPHYVWGRHIVDTLLAVQRFDIARGEIGSYGLKECARAYNIAEPDRVYLDRAEITTIWKADPAKVKAYALGDVRETRRLADLVTPTEFYQTRMVPDSYQNVSVTGSGEKINSILVRAYLQRKTVLPRPDASSSYSGGYTEMRRAGLIRHIVKADVESLYPSIMLSQKIAPVKDTLNLFLPMLKELTQRRLEAKGKAKRASDDSAQFAYWDGLQGSYKLLINSFYGYLGAPFYFNDYQAAGKVTEIGQAIVKDIAAELERHGADVIEIDTDGVYFQPPQTIQGTDAEIAFVGKVGSVLPDGIRLAFDGRYGVMLSLKAKNYVLIGYDGKKIFKGSSLRSRADEKFGRVFLNAAIDLLLGDDRTALAALYQTTMAQIENRSLGIEQIMRRERVTDKTFSSDARKRNADALRGLQVGDYATLYQRSDRTLAAVSEYADDEDTEYYRQKLYKFAERLRAAVGDDFDTLFPKPLNAAQRKAADAAAQQMSLFE